jgi:bacillolysin
MLKQNSRQRISALIFALPVLAACATDNSLLLAENVCPSNTSAQTDSPKYLGQALAYLKANSSNHRVTDACRELMFLDERVDDLQQKHIRFQQSYDGVPVWGQQLLVHLNAENVATSTTGSLQPIAQKISIEPKLDKTIAANTATNAVGEGAKMQDSKLYVYLHQGAPRLVHTVTVMKSLRRTLIFVDAETGVVLNQISATPSQN